MSAADEFRARLARHPYVAILRGIRPDEVEEIGEALIEAGFGLIEVPLNSQDPLASIAELVRISAGRAMIGAGTVLTVDQIHAVAATGAKMIVSPNSDSAVIAATVDNGMASLPGYATPTEAFRAIAAGATALKLFPAEGLSPAVLKAHRAVLPPDLPVLVVGGVTPDTTDDWLAAGAAGFGLGSALYRPGQSAEDVREVALKFV